MVQEVRTLEPCTPGRLGGSLYLTPSSAQLQPLQAIGRMGAVLSLSLFSFRFSASQKKKILKNEKVLRGSSVQLLLWETLAHFWAQSLQRQAWLLPPKGDFSARGTPAKPSAAQKEPQFLP